MASASGFAALAAPIAGSSRLPPPGAQPYRNPRSPTPRTRLSSRSAGAFRARYRPIGSGGGEWREESPDAEDPTFDQAVSLFNGGDYHRSHDFLEELWYVAEEPARTVLHGILQCAVGFHHLFNQNHRGAMMELGEGLCKLRKMDFEDGPFRRFEQEVSVVLEFVYRTQVELAACTEDFCLTMDGSNRSYQLLGSFAAGQRLYNLDADPDGVSYIVFNPSSHDSSHGPSKVKVPTLLATEEHLKSMQV